MRDEDSVKSFFKSWNIYQSVIQNNYMLHQEVITWLQNKFLTLQFQNIRLLELGCGDAFVVSQLDTEFIDSYTGIDLSGEALKFARLHLEDSIKDTHFLCGDMLSKVDNCKGTYHVILAGYSIHHLSKKDKKLLVAKIAEKLKENGHFFMIDILRTPNESRIQYIRRNVENYILKWNKLTPEQLDSIADHVYKCDFPETFETFIHFADLANLKIIEKAYLDQDQIFGIIHFQK